MPRQPYVLLFEEVVPGATPLTILVDDRGAVPLFDSEDKAEGFLASTDFGAQFEAVEVSGAGLARALESVEREVSYVAINPAAAPLRFQAFQVLLAELGDFGGDDHLTVRLETVVAEVVLVVILGDVELVEGNNLRHDGAVPDPLGLDLGDHLFRSALLPFRVVEDHGPVLRPHVRALSIQSRRVVDGEVNLQDVPVGDLVGGERSLHDLAVPRRLRTNLPVGRVGNVAPRVPGLDLLHAPQLLVDRLQTPEAAAAERRDLRAG